MGIETISILILEDEDSALNRLKESLRQIANISITILGEFDTNRSAIDWLKHNNPPDLIFMDIHLADGSSLELFNQITIVSPVIFVTAHDRYAVEAFRLNSLDYLLKPLENNRLKDSIERYLRKRSSFLYKNQLEQLQSMVDELTKPQSKRSFLAFSNGSQFLVNTHDIAYFRINNGYVIITLFNEMSYTLFDSLDSVQSKLDPQLFYRVNRQYLVARSSIHKIENYVAGKLAIVLKPRTRDVISLSKNGVSRFKKWADS